MTDHTTEEVRQKIVTYTANHPELTLSTIAARLEIGCSTLSKLLKDAGYRRRNYQRLASLDLGKLER